MSSPGAIGSVRQAMGCMLFRRESFRSIAERPSLLKAALIVLTIASLAAWASYNYVGKAPASAFAPLSPTPPVGPQPHPVGPRQPPIAPQQLRQFLMLGAIAGSFLSGLAGWVIMSVLFHILSRGLGGRGSLRGMLALTGYASTPFLIQQALRLLDSFLASEAEVARLMGTPMLSADPFLNAVVNNALEAVNFFGIWSSALLVLATRENYALPLRKSAVVAAMAHIVRAVGPALPILLLGLWRRHDTSHPQQRMSLP
ncbi:TPA: YIP1 family protein [Candidatus Bathyarchaeota archaeon]|nr:YIP1 family protein [Candidatus Bathyarchaeota archaeon]